MRLGVARCYSSGPCDTQSDAVAKVWSDFVLPNAIFDDGVAFREGTLWTEEVCRQCACVRVAQRRTARALGGHVLQALPAPAGAGVRAVLWERKETW